jgi:UDP-glucose 4-epimerase
VTEQSLSGFYAGKKVVVVGANGFLGSRFLNRQELQNSSLKLVARSLPIFEPNRSHEIAIVKNFESIQFDKIVEGADVCFFAIGHGGPEKSAANPQLFYKDNHEIAFRIIERIKNAGVEKLIFPSSGGAIYGNCKQEKIQESASLNPISPYGKSKKILEEHLRVLSERNELKSVALRIGNLFCLDRADSGHGGILEVLLKNYFSEGKIHLRNTGHELRDYVEVCDVVTAMLLAGGENSNFAIYNIGTGLGTSVRNLLTELQTVLGPPNIEFLFEDFTRSHETINSVLDGSLFEAKFGWKPKSNIFESISAGYANKNLFS